MPTLFRDRNPESCVDVRSGSATASVKKTRKAKPKALSNGLFMPYQLQGTFNSLAQKVEKRRLRAPVGQSRKGNDENEWPCSEADACGSVRSAGARLPEAFSIKLNDMDMVSRSF
jgi:hypothetical protein